MENQLLIALSKNKLLKNVDISKISLAEIKGKLITVGEGEILYREGDTSDTIYLVISGELNVIKKRLLGKTKSYIFIENDFFGNEEYFEETSRTSTAVALRDSYLIALSHEEIENLISQEQQVFQNLKEPVAETEDDFTIYEKEISPDNSDDGIDLSTMYDDANKEETADKNDESSKPEEEFFKSIADVSRADDINLIPSLENQTKEKEAKDEFEMLSFDEDEVVDGDELKKEAEIFNEDGIPKAEFDLSEMKSDENEEHKKDEIEFDESAFLNEDGIPKAEFEIPGHNDEQSAEPEDVDNSKHENIITNESSEIRIKTETDKTKDESITSEDENFFAAFPTEEPKKYDEMKTERFEWFESPAEEITNDEQQAQAQIKQKAEPQEEEIVEAQPYKKHFDNEDILAEAEEKLRKIEKGEPVIKSKNWRTISYDGGEMTSEQLQMIIKAAEHVNSTVKVDEVLRNVVEVATNLTDADRGTLYLIDREKNELWSLVAIGSETKEIRLKVGEGLAGYVASSGEVVNIKDVKEDPRFKSDFDKSSGYETKNMLCYPIRNNKNEIIGVLQLLNSKNNEFSKLDENFLNAISIHSAIALQNAAMVDKLLQAERVQSLGKMANFLIQDIKKPVLVAKRYAEHLKSKDLAQDVSQVIDMLLEQLSQVADIVQTTSSYSDAKTILRTLNVSLNNTLMDYAARIGSYVESRNCRVDNEFDKDVTVKLDVKEFYQCYLHIVKNACDAMPEGGKIVVSTKRDDRRIKIFIKDKGLGIPDGFKDKIFEPFMSYGKKEGTGLGLSITKKVVEAHNGTIEVESALGEGAAFIVTLPVASTF